MNMNRADLVEWIDLAPKVAFAVGAVAYGAGLLIVNSYLQTYGVYTTSLLRADFVLTGLLWLFILALSSALVVAIASFVPHVKRHWRAGRRVSAVFLAVLCGPGMSGLLVLPASLFSGSQLNYFDGTTWILIAKIMLPTAAFLWTTRQARSAVSAWRLKKEGLGDFPLSQVTLALVVGLGIPASYARVAYPLFLPTYGGGRPVQVRVFTDTQEASVRATLRQDEPDPGAFLLVAESGEWLVLAERSSAAIEPRKRVTVRIRREAVTALQVLAR